MDRYVFCPNDSMLEEAFAMATEWSLPILNGDSPRSESLDFDRSKVSVINIPIFKEFYGCPEIIEANMAYSFKYRNDFIDCSKIEILMSTMNLVLNQTTKLMTRLVSPHEVDITVGISSLGDYMLTVVNEQISIDTHRFTVLSEMSQNPDEMGAYD